jgi:hypothetical protein
MIRALRRVADKRETQFAQSRRQPLNLPIVIHRREGRRDANRYFAAAAQQFLGALDIITERFGFLGAFSNTCTARDTPRLVDIRLPALHADRFDRTNAQTPVTIPALSAERENDLFGVGVMHRDHPNGGPVTTGPYRD